MMNRRRQSPNGPWAGRLKRFSSGLAIVVAVPLLGACAGATQPATNVTDTGAKLNARGYTDDGPATWWWEYDTVRSELGTAFDTEVCGNPHEADRRCGPAQGGSSNNQIPLSVTVTGLTPDATYHFRACGQDVNDPQPTCAQTLSFKTKGVASWSNGWGTYTSTGKVWPGANWRAFADTAAFNQRLPTNPPVVQSQQQHADALAQHVIPFTGSGDSNVWFSNSGDPQVLIDAPGNTPVHGTMIRIPRAAIPDAQEDGHISIADSNTGYLTECWQATIDWDVAPPEMECVSADQTPINGDGLMQRSRITAGGIAKLAGQVWPSEFAAGHIPHALVLNVQCVTGYVYPAQNPNDFCNGPWLGGRVWLDLSPAQIAAISNPNARTLARALNEYGAYVRDSGNCCNGDWAFGAISGESFTRAGTPDPWSEFQAVQPTDIPWDGNLHIIDPCTAKGTC
jgi:hypothetical protein